MASHEVVGRLDLCRGLVAIGQHCRINAPIARWRGILPCRRNRPSNARTQFASMTIAEEIATADQGAAAPKQPSRMLGSSAVTVALLSATVTFAVLAGLTPIAPTHQVVVSLLAVDAL